ncbi:MAG TPA: hypothetical protein VFE53_07105 [Mucilaginibacter sp.]|jgi:hypothetical protein|nr:hypothetical protein [Mucilaginibacter sp.]
MSKKYILKPGRHQFAPRSPAIHTNDNLADEDAEWYLQKYPHIASLFEAIPTEEIHPAESDEKSVQSLKIGAIQNNNNEDLFTTN